jgi:GT2 family glycosyltransferase
MAVFDTEENQRTALTRRTLECLIETVDLVKHRLIVIDNNSCKATRDVYQWLLNYIVDTEYATGMQPSISIIDMPENVGTAEAINQAIRLRRPGEPVIKMDNDVVIHSNSWVEEMEQAIARDPQIGICGLKRKDLIQTTWHHDPHFRSEYKMLPHSPGERWICVEKSGDIIGTCTMYNPLLLDKIGYLQQIKKYGYDDNIACHKSHLSGFYNCFLSHIEIDHIDPGDTPYQDWKHKHSSECTESYKQLIYDLIAGKKPIYYNPFSNDSNI